MPPSDAPPHSAPTPSPRPLPSLPTTPRSLRLYLAAFWTLLIGFLAFVLWKLIVGDLAINWSSPWLGSFAFLATAFILAYRYGRLQVIRNFLAPHSGFICPRCHYTLRALPDEGTCPECGTSYTRASVVALWEHTYGLASRYPRVSPRTAQSAPQSLAPATKPSTPWSTWTLQDSLAKLEAGARNRGFAAARFPALARDLDAACLKLSRPLPTDLHAFLARLDPALWARFIHTQPAPVQPTPRSDDPAAAWLDQPAPPTQHIEIRNPTAMQVATLAQIAPTRDDLRAFADSLSANNRPPAWLNTQLIAFADSSRGRTIFYTTDPPDLPRGSIITFIPGEPDRLWLADSLSQWLTRIAACDGIDCLLDPALVHRVPPTYADSILSESRSKNPHATTIM